MVCCCKDSKHDTMKTNFSVSWKASKQPRKQRKYRVNAPLHIRRKMLGAHLSKELRVKYKTRAISLRKGDKVKVMRGQYKNIIGEVEMINIKKFKIQVKGVEEKKKEGRVIKRWVDPSKLQIITLNLDDKRRVEALNRK